MKTLRIAAPLALLCGCALAPGMRMDEGAALERGRAKDPKFEIERVTPALVARLSAERARRSPGLADPLAAMAAHYQYTVAPHDVLQVTVWDHPELTAPTGQFRSPEENGNPVNADGTVFYPHVGTVAVLGKTVPEIRQLLTDRIARVVRNPQLDVRVASFRGKRVQVTGEVTAPTAVPITDVPLRVQDALAAAKGFTPEADFSRVTLSRGGKTVALDLQSLYERGDLSQNWTLQDGDVVNVPDRSRNKVFVLGEVRAQHAKQMVRGRMTLAEALLDPAGGSPGGIPGTVMNGFDPAASNVSKIYVLRGDYEAPHVFHLDASSPDALLLATLFPLEPRDIVFVSTYELARFNRVVLQMLPTIQGIWQSADLANRASSLR